MRPRRTFYRAYSGNVTREHPHGGASAVLWERGKPYSEEQIAKMLDDAYKAGVRDARNHVEDAIIALTNDLKG